MAQKTPPEVAKYALLAIVWGFIAILAFIFLPWVINSNGTFTGFEYIAQVGSKGLGAINKNVSSSLSDPAALAFLFVILFSPLAAILAIGLSIGVRVRDKMGGLITGEMIASALGVVGVLAMFIPNVAENPTDQRNFGIAAGIVVLSTVLSQLQKQLRQFFSTQPTLASVVLIALVYVTVVLSNIATFAQLVVTKSGIWLGLVSFLLMFYAGTKMAREARKARRK